ncbi:MAG: hypothetical protein M3N16_07700 [Actinomycetota bacterium]|nr:hypothetical protein [Actinomycetota bacterium]
MRPSAAPKRYVLVPSDGVPDPEPSGGKPPRPRVRRYGLARVAVSPRSALGADWHRRLEDAADRERS